MAYGKVYSENHIIVRGKSIMDGDCTLEDSYYDISLIAYTWGYDVNNLNGNKLGHIEVSKDYYKIYKVNGKLISLSTNDKLTFEQIREYYDE